MDQFKGTPGPWTGKDVGICKQDKVGLQLGFIMTSDESRAIECAANANLIVAAPDLLEALQYCLDSLGDEFALPADCKIQASAAIAKALGKE